MRKTRDILDEIKHNLIKEYGTQTALASKLGSDDATVSRRFSKHEFFDFVAAILDTSGHTIVAIDELGGLYYFAQKGIEAVAKGGKL